MRIEIKTTLFMLLVILSFNNRLFAQEGDGSNSENLTYSLSMEEAMELAQLNSIASMQYKNIFTSSYWSFRAYKASVLPSLVFSSGVGNLNHSLIQLQDATTGAISYYSNYSLSNTAQISVDQVISATGGTLSLYSSLERLDQFGNNSGSDYYSQPVSLSYLQPIFSYNSYKWDKKIEPKTYEKAKKEYLENMEQVTLNAVNLYWQYSSAYNNYKIAKVNFEQSKDLYKTSVEKFNLGTMTKTSLLQLELKVLNDSLSMNDYNVTLISTRNSLCSYIGLRKETQIDVVVDLDLPEVTLEYIDVLEDALRNSSFSIDQQIQILEAQRSVASAKGDKGISMQLNARFGLSNNNSVLKSAYQNLMDQEVVGLTISVPIFDWGMGRGKVQMAKAQEQTTINQLAQSMIDYEQDVYLKVMKFNNQIGQCKIAQKAAEIAAESYRLATQNFLNGSMTVTELNSVRSENDSAQEEYISAVGSYWTYFYEIRQLTLHDYMLKSDISAEFDKIVNNVK